MLQAFPESSATLLGWFRDYLWYYKELPKPRCARQALGTFTSMRGDAISWRGYWQELIEIVAYSHLCAPVLASIWKGAFSPAALSIVQARCVGLAHFSVGRSRLCASQSCAGVCEHLGFSLVPGNLAYEMFRGAIGLELALEFSGPEFAVGFLVPSALHFTAACWHLGWAGGWAHLSVEVHGCRHLSLILLSRHRAWIGFRFYAAIRLGRILACVGPVLDVSAQAAQAAAIFDAALVLRPVLFFRTGGSLRNSIPSFASAFLALPGQSFAHGRRALRQGFLALALLLRTFYNHLFAEIHQVSRGGLLRAVSLAATEGLSASSPACCLFQPLHVQVGSSALGRIFNALGSGVDSYLEPQAHLYYQDAWVIGSTQLLSRPTNCMMAFSERVHPARCARHAEGVAVYRTHVTEAAGVWKWLQ
jgi:hypothetical protein